MPNVTHKRMHTHTHTHAHTRTHTHTVVKRFYFLILHFFPLLDLIFYFKPIISQKSIFISNKGLIPILIVASFNTLDLLRVK